MRSARAEAYSYHRLLTTYLYDPCCVGVALNLKVLIGRQGFQKLPGILSLREKRLKCYILLPELLSLTGRNT